MKSRILFPFLVLAGVILLVGLACGTTPTTTPSPPPIQIQPTQPPPTEALTEAPTEAPAEAPAYFTEEFDNPIPNWTYFLMGEGDEEKFNISEDNGYLVFDLKGEHLIPYLTYDPWIYKNVRIDARAENRGYNTNWVSLICRYNPDVGWYEFNIGNDGLYTIYAYDNVLIKGYENLFNGGSTAIRSGRNVNDYTVICDDNTLSLYINGVEVRTIKEKKFNFSEGQVGISVTSYDVIPIIVAFDWVTISEP